jgi:hypothetical protein
MPHRPLPWPKRIEPLARALGMTPEELGQRLDRIVWTQGNTASAPAGKKPAGAKRAGTRVKSKAKAGATA